MSGTIVLVGTGSVVSGVFCRTPSKKQATERVMALDQLCKRCDTINSAGAQFCSLCGAELIDWAAKRERYDERLIGTVVDGRFRLLKRIGKGGMASVFSALQISVGRMVALKIMRPRLIGNASLKTRFLKEATYASRLNHPNSVTIYDLGETPDGILYIAMELIEGGTLSDEIMKYRPMAWRRACGIGAQICSSLQDAHDQDIVHRDLKPANIMLCSRGKGEALRQIVKVLDFGIAQTMGEERLESAESRRSSKEILGTPDYMSPEQISGLPLDNRSDIYALGTVLYRMVTGELPFTVETPLMIMAHHLHHAPRPFCSVSSRLSALPPRLEQLIMSMLQKDPEARPQTMHEVGLRLERLRRDRSRGFLGFTPSCGIRVDDTILKNILDEGGPAELALDPPFREGDINLLESGVGD